LIFSQLLRERPLHFRKSARSLTLAALNLQLCGEIGMEKTFKPLWILLFVVAMVCAGFAQEAKVTVLNPRGTPAPVPLVPMAPRLATLDGKTVYLVDIKYEGGASLLQAIMEWFSKNIPKTNLVVREKGGSYDQEDPKLWAEIKDKADAVIMAVGH
jgi:hypothetical protein